ncbi:chelonianin-like [Cochliomyia hominivorax]
MKFLTISALFLVIFISYTTAQLQTCHGAPWRGMCAPPPNRGTGGRGCQRRVMWYNDRAGRQCRSMIYLGCGGNNNRWCNRAECERRCRW